MADPRNPFRLRASENIDSDATFLRLFEPSALEVLPPGDVWRQVLLIRSAPGGGKTTLLRLLQPEVLLTLLELKRLDECRELFERLKALGAIGEEGPRVLGIKLSFARNYDVFASLRLEARQRRRLFLGLLNAQTLLAGLRAAAAYHRLSFPSELGRIDCSYVDGLELPPEVRNLTSGAAVFAWASEMETAIYGALDSFRPEDIAEARGHDRFLAPLMLRPGAMSCAGAPLAERVLLMLDDGQKLAPLQRQQLLELLTEDRPDVAVWVAERNQALSTEELLGARQGRDYGELWLESHWRSRPAKFTSLLQHIADRRTRTAADFETSSFAGFLDTSREVAPPRIGHDIVGAARQRAVEAGGRSERYLEWLDIAGRLEGSPWEQAVAWEAVSILIQRDTRKAQTTFNFALNEDDLQQRDDASVHAAAELFLCRRHKIPYYFGFDRLTRLASSNIEQFLALAGDEFEEISAGALLRKSWRLSAKRQDLITRRMSDGVWRQIPVQARNGRDVQRFLERMARVSYDATYSPNAPYAPGVTGIAITTRESDLLRQPEFLSANVLYRQLADVLASAIAHNFLEPLPNQRQGKKGGDTWTVLYLNRLLCARFDLPLQFGGWRPKSLRELSRWMQELAAQPTMDLA